MNKIEHTRSEVSNGVNALIERLREEGVAKGQAEAKAILDAAKSEANSIRTAAQKEAQLMRETARKTVEDYKHAGDEALATAARDAVLNLKTEIAQRFRADVSRLVSHEMKNPDLLQKIILELVGKARPKIETKDAIEIVLPSKAIGLEDLKENLEELDKGPLTDFVRGIAGDLIREGVTFSNSAGISAGAQIYLEDENVTIELTDLAVANMLTQHLQPRFRAILEGVVK